MDDYQVVGKGLPRVDAVLKATGQAEYCPDLALPGMLWGKILRSPYPHARIVYIDTARAMRLRGVRAVITGKDTSGKRYGIWPDTPQTMDQLPLAIDKVRYIGDEVAAVAAVDPDIAEEAAELIQVEYDELEPIFDPEEAMKPGAPRIHEVENNIAWAVRFHHGDVETGFRESDYVREDTFVTHNQCHCTMESHGALARYEPPGKVTVWTSTQSLHTVRMELARTLDMPLSQVRVIKAYVGGGFGCKTRMYGAHFCSALLAKVSGRPVKVIYDREEQFIGTLERHAMVLRLKTGVKRDGTLMAKECTAIADGGAYNSHGSIIIGRVGAQLSLIYRVPNMKYTGYRAYTNKPACGAFRGFGNIQARFADESQMDMIAEELGLDPVEIRLKNATQPGDTTAHRWKITSCGLSESIKKAAQEIGWPERSAKLPPGRGLGIACGGYIAGTYIGHDSAAAFVKVNEDGGVTILIGASDIGQGSDTLLCQIAAEELGVTLDKVKISAGDSELTPLDLGTFASRITIIAGNAVKAAAADARSQLFQLMAHIWEANPNDLEARDNRVYIKGSEEKALSFAEAVQACLYRRGQPILGKGSYNPPHCENLEKETGAGNFSPAYSFGAQAVEVEVDPLTGRVKVLKVAAAHDCGFAINPTQVHGQIDGSIAMGLGWALSEQVHRDNGQLLNPSLLEYRLPTALDVPQIDSFLIEPIEPHGPFGAKGVSEGTMLPIAPAIANAIYRATGVRIKELPLTPDKVLAALEKSR